MSLFTLWLLWSALFLLVLLLLVKLYFTWTKGVFKSDAKLHGKIVLITGGNVGIGKEYVRDLASRGATVIMACRNVQRGEECARAIHEETEGNSKIIVERCDLSSLHSVRALCSRIMKREDVPRLDFLVVFAAAVGDNTPVDQLTGDGLEMQFQCNYLSHFLMVHLLFGKLKESEHARIIVASSAAHLMGKLDLDNIARLDKYSRPMYMTYGDSKLALVALARELADRLGPTSRITVNCFSPGTVLTNGIKHNHFWYVKFFLMILAFLHGKSAKDGAQTMLYLTLAEEVQGLSGMYFADCAKAPYNRLVDDRKLRQDLWQLSMHLVKPYLGPSVDPLLE